MFLHQINAVVSPLLRNLVCLFYTEMDLHDSRCQIYHGLVLSSQSSERRFSQATVIGQISLFTIAQVWIVLKMTNMKAD